MSNEITNNGIRFLAISMKNKGIEVNENDLNNFFRNNKDIDVQEAGNSLTQYFRGYLGMGDNFNDDASGALQEALNIIADAEVGDSTISYDEVYGHDYSDLIEEESKNTDTEAHPGSISAIVMPNGGNKTTPVTGDPNQYSQLETDAATAGTQALAGTNDGAKPIEEDTNKPTEDGDGETPAEEEIDYDSLTGRQYIIETLKEYGVELSEDDLNNMLEESNGDVKLLARSIYNNAIKSAENLNGNKTDIDLAVSNVLDEIAGEDGVIQKEEIERDDYSIDDGIFDGTEYILQTLTDNGYDIDKKTLKDILNESNINGKIDIDNLYGAINSAIEGGIDTKTKTQLNSVLEKIANGDRTITTDELTADYKSDEEEAPEDVAPESDKPASTSQEPLSIALDSGGKKELYYDEDGNPKIKLYNSLGGLVYERNIYKYERAQFNELGANIPEPEPEKTDEAGGTSAQNGTPTTTTESTKTDADYETIINKININFTKDTLNKILIDGSYTSEEIINILNKYKEMNGEDLINKIEATFTTGKEKYRQAIYQASYEHTKNILGWNEAKDIPEDVRNQAKDFVNAFKNRKTMQKLIDYMDDEFSNLDDQTKAQLLVAVQMLYDINPISTITDEVWYGNKQDKYVTGALNSLTHYSTKTDQQTSATDELLNSDKTKYLIDNNTLVEECLGWKGAETDVIRAFLNQDDGKYVNLDDGDKLTNLLENYLANGATTKDVAACILSTIFDGDIKTMLDYINTMENPAMQEECIAQMSDLIDYLYDTYKK